MIISFIILYANTKDLGFGEGIGVTGISGARVRVRVRVRVRDFIYITWRLLLRLCPSIRLRLFPKCDLLEVHCWTAAVAAHYVGVTSMEKDTNPKHLYRDLYDTRNIFIWYLCNS